MQVEKVLKILEDEYDNVSMLGSFTDKSPFQQLIATVLSARNRDDQTSKVVEKLFPKYPTAEALSKAEIADLEKMVKQTGFYKVKARRIKGIAQILIDNYNGEVPDDFDELLTIPGIGRKTAGCVMVYAFKKPAIPVDTHVHRISNRLGWVKTKTPEETEQVLMKIVPKKHWMLVNEGLVLHGQNICKPITPICSKCAVSRYCKRIRVKRSQ